MSINKSRGGKNNLTEVELEYAFMHADSNNDGSISVPEFIVWVTGGGRPADGEGAAREVAQAQLFEKKKELRGPERFFYDQSTYTGTHTQGGPDVHQGSGDALKDSMRNSKAPDRTQSGGVAQRRPSQGSNEPGHRP